MEKSKRIEQNFAETALTLSQALPYLQRYDNAIIVIKLGGHAMANKKMMEGFARDVVLMKQCNVNPIIIHGGGPMINELLSKMKIKTNFLDGKRITDEKSMPIIEMVLSGKLNKDIVSEINMQGGKAVGLSGKDANLMICEPDKPELGFVGKPIKINLEILRNLVESDFIPVIAPIGVNANGETFNVNADTAAGAIASSIKADRLLLLTDVAGVVGKQGDVLTKLTVRDIKDLLTDGTIVKGMVPKANTAIRALNDGVRAVVILDGRTSNACLLELFTDHGAGTLIKL
jgi:acetylglutamate kinase